jgi:hypothetical protein
MVDKAVVVAWGERKGREVCNASKKARLLNFLSPLSPLFIHPSSTSLSLSSRDGTGRAAATTAKP